MIMAHLDKVLARLDQDRGECIEAWDGIKKIHFDFHPAKGRKDTQRRLVVISPGWLGSLTFNPVAKQVSYLGHDVAVVNHEDSSFMDVLHPNEARSRRLHAVTKAAVVRSGIDRVHIIDHSNGHRDATSAVKYQIGRDPEIDKLTYRVEKVTAIDGVGSNGRVINPFALYQEILNYEELLDRKTTNFLKVIGYSALNFARNPLLSTIEGVGTLRYDSLPDMEAFTRAGVEVSRIFHEDDSVIPPPDLMLLDCDIHKPSAQGNVIIMPGGHLHTPTDEETLFYAVA
jgi:hypothetical protein